MHLKRIVLLTVFASSVAACDENPPNDDDGGLDVSSDLSSDVVGFDVDVATIDRVVTPAVCGNGAVESGELCDDGNVTSGDGCREDCRSIDPDYQCTVSGMRCVTTAVCGDGRIGGPERCDDRNTVSGDGCDARCNVEPGWRCPIQGIACRAAACGDRVRIDVEACDDGNMMAGDGCSAECQLEDGFDCNAAGMCTRVTCGNNTREGTEQCDDGNNLPGDGCFECRREPMCNDGCTTQCGDGVLLAPETCDDGNTRSNDGCSATCSIEAGFQCTATAGMAPTELRVPVVYRDFRGVDLPGGHRDFEDVTGNDIGIVTNRLADGKPVYANATGMTPTTHGRAGFDQWYRNTPGVNITYVDRLTLGAMGAGTYVFDSAAFFPLDGRGFVMAGSEPVREGHNFHFTSELRYWFTYAGGERLSFRGDDDVWVFINGRLAVDLGGVHGPANGEITLNAANAAMLNLTAGRLYETVVFQAERHTVGSEYRLTLAGFNLPRSRCNYVCGDGIVTRFEACDDGTNNGTYGGCMPGCMMRAAFCGDRMINPMEECDDGNMVNGDGCSTMCRREGPG
jgi:fibro-slime domain-containing protein